MNIVDCSRVEQTYDPGNPSASIRFWVRWCAPVSVQCLGGHVHLNCQDDFAPRVNRLGIVVSIGLFSLDHIWTAHMTVVAHVPAEAVLKTTKYLKPPYGLVPVVASP